MNSTQMAQNRKPTVFLIDIDSELSRSIMDWIKGEGGRAVLCESEREFLDADVPDVACAVVRMSGSASSSALLGPQMMRSPLPPLIFIVENADAECSIDLFRRGAADVFMPPIKLARLTQSIAEAWLRHVNSSRLHAEDVGMRARLRLLTPREQEVFPLLLTGLLNKQIAGELNICENTVKVHRKRIMDKMGVGSLVELARRIERIGMFNGVSRGPALNAVDARQLVSTLQSTPTPAPAAVSNLSHQTQRVS